MIRALRRRHLGLFFGLAVAVPAGLAAGLWNRMPVPVQESPAALAAGEPALRQVLTDSDDLWSPLSIRTRVGRDGDDLVVELTPREDLLQPDVLVYWSAVVPAGDGLPPDVTLLGALAGTWSSTFRMPSQTLTSSARDSATSGNRRSAGHLILYSLAHQRRVGTASLAGLTGTED